MPDVDPQVQDILRFFAYDHLPEGPLRETSEACAELAYRMAADLPAGALQFKVGLQRLLDAKDAFVRAALPGADGPGEPPPHLRPGNVLDLTGWDLTLPTDGARIIQDLTTGYTDEFFYVDASRVPSGEVVLTTPIDGDPTKGSLHARTELHEKIDGKRASWSTTEGLHTLTIVGAVTAAPPVVPKVVIGQVHNSKRKGSDDVFQFMYDGLVDGGALVSRYLGKRRMTLIQPYALGTVATLGLRIADGIIEVYADGTLKNRIPHRESGLYFEAGCYPQSTLAKGDKHGAYGQVRLTELTRAHTG